MFCVNLIISCDEKRGEKRVVNKFKKKLYTLLLVSYHVHFYLSKFNINTVELDTFALTFMYAQ